MSTRSTIAILKKDGSVSSIYCHSDGYLSFNGMLLEQHYQDAEKVNKLINLGQISSLGEEVDIPNGVKHSFDKRATGITTFYGRDRGEKEVDAVNYKSFEDYASNGDFQEYDYVFDETKKNWFLLKPSTGKLTKLLPLLAKEKTVTGEDKQFVVEKVNAIKTVKLKNKIEKITPEKVNVEQPKKVKL